MINSKGRRIYIAIGALATLLIANPASAATFAEEALAHFQLANAMVHAGKHQQAMDEYKAAYRLAPAGRVGEYSLRALAAYGVSPNSHTIAQADNEIRRQSEEAKAEANKMTAYQIKVSNRIADARINRIENERNASVNEVITNPSLTTVVVPTYGHGYYRNRYNHGYAPYQAITTVDPVATQARINNVNTRAEQLKNGAKADAQEKANQLKEAADEHARIIDDTANGLNSQMHGKGVKLNPNGTNLYVRQYQ